MYVLEDIACSIWSIDISGQCCSLARYERLDRPCACEGWSVYGATEPGWLQGVLEQGASMIDVSASVDEEGGLSLVVVSISAAEDRGRLDESSRQGGWTLDVISKQRILRARRG